MDEDNLDVESLRKTEFSRLQGQVYLDNAGSALYANSHLRKHLSDLERNLYCNPHSGDQMTDIIDQVRSSILSFFDVTVDDYDVIFTSGATSSLQLIGESFQWQPGSVFAYLEDNHTSVVGIREIAVLKEASSYCICRNLANGGKLKESSLSGFFPKLLKRKLDEKNEEGKQTSSSCLFAYPAQSNFSGTKYPLSWINGIKKNGCHFLENHLENEREMSRNNWYILCDAASFVSTSFLDLKKYPADFIPISFYKMFGFPTGLGALLVNKESSKLLSQKSYFGGGSVSGWLAAKDFHTPKPLLHEKYEDGTISFLGILAVKHGFDTFKQLGFTIKLVQFHTFKLIQILYEEMLSLKHYNGYPVIKVYAESNYDSLEKQGPILAFNVMRSDGSFYGYNYVLQMASSHNFHLRGGCFCNMGACSYLLGIDNDILVNSYKEGHVCGDKFDLINGKPIGAVRASLGYSSTEEDVRKFIDFLSTTFMEENPEESADLFYDAPSDLTSNEAILEKIVIYPVKSCQGMEVSSWQLSQTGLLFDRMWMIVDEHNIPITLKKDSKLVLITPIINIEDSSLMLSCEGKESIQVPFLYRDENGKQMSRLSNASCLTKVCGDNIEAFDCGVSVSEWLTAITGYKCFLLQKDLTKERFIKQRFRQRSDEASMLSLVNEAQYLLINRASVEYLYDKMNKNMSDDTIDNWMKRFRGNFVVSGVPAFAEDTWTSISMISVSVEESQMLEFSIVGLCNRCSMICVDPNTGERTNEPLKSLTKLTSSESTHRKTTFGVYLRSTLCNKHLRIRSKLVISR